MPPIPLMRQDCRMGRRRPSAREFGDAVRRSGGSTGGNVPGRDIAKRAATPQGWSWLRERLAGRWLFVGIAVAMAVGAVFTFAFVGFGIKTSCTDDPRHPACTLVDSAANWNLVTQGAILTGALVALIAARRPRWIIVGISAALSAVFLIAVIAVAWGDYPWGP